MASIYQLEQSLARLEIEKINIEARIKYAKNQLGIAIIKDKAREAKKWIDAHYAVASCHGLASL